jgi:hypothetical protein
LQSRYKPRRGGGGGGSGGYGAKKPYTLTHKFHYQPENYKANSQPRRNSPIIIHKNESNSYRMPRIEYREEPDTEELLKKLENRFGEKFEERVREILEKMNSESSESVEDMKMKLEADFENDELTEDSLSNIEDAEKELNENEVSEEEFKKDMELSDEAEVISEELADKEPTVGSEEASVEPVEDAPEVEDQAIDTFIESADIPTAAEINETEELRDLVESVNNAIDIPPEEFAEPNENFARMAEAVLENPTLADQIDPKIWPEIEILASDLQDERLEPEAEYVESGYY